jgi:hypothetical protein
MIRTSKSRTRTQLEAIKIKSPACAGDYWQMISHIDMITAMEDAFVKAKMVIHQHMYAVSRDKTNLAASWIVIAPDCKPIYAERFSIGVTTNNKLREGIRFYTGTVSTEGLPLVYEKLSINKKHTRNLNLSELCDDAIFLAHKSFQLMNETASDLNRTTQEKSDILTIIFDARKCPRLITWAQANELVHNTKEIMTEMSIYQAFSETIKQRNPMLQMEDLFRFLQIIKSHRTLA